MKMVFYVVITILGCVSCSSRTKTKDPVIVLQQDTTIVYEKVYPKYDMSDLNIKELAELLVKEKNAGEFNESAFADFFRRCGMEYGELPEEMCGYLVQKYDVCEGYYKVYLGQKAFITAISVNVNSNHGYLHHSIGIQFPEEDTDRLQWMIVQLRAFEIKGEAGKLEGKGLYCIYSRGNVLLGY